MKIKKITCLLMALAMVWMTASCRINDGSVTELTDPPTAQHPPPTEPTGDVTEPSATEPDGTVPNEGVEDPTEPDVTDPTGDDVTGPTEAAPSEPGTDVTEPDVTEPTENGGIELPPVPTDPVPTDPVVTEPVSPKPPVTEVPEDPTEAPTDPPATKPAPTDPPATKHVHDYSTKVVKPTCTKKGYTKYTCDCGDSYKDDYVDKLAHSYTFKVVKPTCEEKGYTKYTCECGDSYKDNYTDAGNHDYALVKAEEWMWEQASLYECTGCGDERWEYEPLPDEKLQESCRAVADAVLKYINQYRVEQGDTEAQMLPGLTQIAEDRAVQLIDNFAHTSLRPLYNSYQYGEYFDVSDWGEGYENYWDADAKEAIACGGSGATADEIGRGIAYLFYSSANHWAYVGSSEFPYIGIGISYDRGDIYTCTLQTRNNYG